MDRKRRDKKGRVLLEGESQRTDGRYSYRFTDGTGKRREIYSWRLTEADKTPAGKRHGPSLREMESGLGNTSEITTYDERRVTLNEYFSRFIEQKSAVIRISTLWLYKRMFRRYARETIGHRRLCDLRYSDITSFYSTMMEVYNLDPRTVSIFHGLMHQMLESAVLDGIIEQNPSDRAFNGIRHLLSLKEKKRHALTVEEQYRLLEFVRTSKRFKMHYPILLFLTGTGCRIGEASGLRWEDVDFGNRIISVNHSLAEAYGTSSDKLIIQLPKTKLSIRTIPMIAEVEDVLRAEYVRQKKEGFCKTEICGYSGFVFSHSKGSVYDSNYLSRVLKTIVETANKDASAVRLPHITPHVLRHTFCTRFCENTSNIKVIQNVMGHSSISMTMDVYTDVSKEVEREQIQALNGKISPA